MCGICGYVGQRLAASLPEALAGLSAGIIHRGPDEAGSFVAPGVGLAMRRLSIVDISGGRQPVANEDGSIQVVFNGEIYNYVELRADLERRGHRLTTQGDSEVLAHLYEDHGPEMLGKLRGMFAFALWDSRQQRLLLARDRLGKKPLNYAPSGDGLFFCSEIFPLAALAGVSREIDAAAVAAYLTAGCIPAPLTIFQGIRKLPPGHFLTWQGGQTVIQRYWRIRHEPKLACDYEEAKERVRAKLDESIRIRLRSDVPVGLLLSGGLDSNAILARLVRGLGRRVKTFTIGFEEPRYDESELARLAAAHFGVEHCVLPARADLLDLTPQLVRHYGEPFADKSALPSLLVSELTRGQVKVALNGDGGDEAFAGYGKYRLAPWQLTAANLLPVSLRRRWAACSLLGEGILGTKPARNLRRLLLPDTESLFTSEFFTGAQFTALAAPDLRAATRSALTGRFGSFWEGSTSAVDRMLAWDYEHYLPDDLLVKMDIASMAHGLEVRSPLLDHELVELCASLPPAWKVDARRGKKLLRELVEPELPPQLLAAPKRGFSVPLEEWWRGAARDRVRAHLQDLHPALRGLINAPHLTVLLDEHQRGRRNHAQRLWCLWVLNAWARENCRG